MSSLSNRLSLNKRTIQILDDKSLVDIRGGAQSGPSCKHDSCIIRTCGENSCKANQVAGIV